MCVLDPVIPSLEIYSKEIICLTHKDMSIGRFFTTKLLTLLKNWKPQYIHTIEYYAAIKIFDVFILTEMERQFCVLNEKE